MKLINKGVIEKESLRMKSGRKCNY